MNTLAVAKVAWKSDAVEESCYGLEGSCVV